jgi:hypothetical protein
VTQIKQYPSSRVAGIPRPTGDKEVVKVNAYERAISLNTQLGPVFPYFGPGSLVPTVCLQRGRPSQDHGQFFHENSQEEITFVLGANQAKVNTGDLIVSTKVHGVNAFLRDVHDPEAFLLLVIIQRQVEADAGPEGQYEAVHLRCAQCQELLLRHAFNADPETPEEHGGSEDDRFPMFATVWGTLTCVQQFNDEESLRTCTKCGHVNDPFPYETWGWHDYVKQQRAVNKARTAMLAAVGDRLSRVEAAS